MIGVQNLGHNEIVTILGSEILNGVYRPGTILPSETDLRYRFGVSRVVVREVIKTLSAKGLVAAKSRVGTRVLDPRNWNFFDAGLLTWRMRMGLDEDFRMSLTEVRRAIEPYAAALAAQRRTDTDVSALREQVELMATPNHTRHSFAKVDLEFHLRVGEASGNPLMRSMSGVIDTALTASCYKSSAVDDLNDLRGTVQIHSAIVDAIEARDEGAAAVAMLEAIDIGNRRINKVLNKRR